MKLVIFDLDQTLVDFIGAHDDTIRQLFQKFFHLEAHLTEIDFAGHNLIDNFVILGRLKGVPEELIKGKKRELLSEYEHIFMQNLPQNATEYVLPGVPKLLEMLSKTDNIIALYTGDSVAIVKKVLAATGLAKYFRFCFYGTETQTRPEMIQKAIEQAGQWNGQRFSGKDVVVIGDSVRDIEAGKPFNALTIAVGTGFHSLEELSDREPDFVFKNMANFQEILKAIESGEPVSLEATRQSHHQ